MDKENPAVSSAVTKPARRLVGQGSPKSEPLGKRPPAASPARNKSQKQGGNDYRGNQSRRPLSPLDDNILQPSSQQPAPSEEMAARARQSLNIDQEESDLTDDFEIFCDDTQCSYRAPEPIHALHGFPAPGPAPVQQGCAPKSLCSQQLDFQADFAAQPIDDEQFEDQNGPIVRRKTPSEQEIGARALQSLHIDNEDDGKFEVGLCPQEPLRGQRTD